MKEWRAPDRCPHCGHTGEGLQFAFDNDALGRIDLSRIQAACLSCGVHGPMRSTPKEAVEAFEAGEHEVLA